jgi:hypothetical protein
MRHRIYPMSRYRKSRAAFSGQALNSHVFKQSHNCSSNGKALNSFVGSRRQVHQHRRKGFGSRRIRKAEWYAFGPVKPDVVRHRRFACRCEHRGSGVKAAAPAVAHSPRIEIAPRNRSQKFRHRNRQVSRTGDHLIRLSTWLLCNHFLSTTSSSAASKLAILRGLAPKS